MFSETNECDLMVPMFLYHSWRPRHVQTIPLDSVPLLGTLTATTAAVPFHEE
jgi:hypothetical protein